MWEDEEECGGIIKDVEECGGILRMWRDVEGCEDMLKDVDPEVYWRMWRDCGLLKGLIFAFRYTLSSIVASSSSTRVQTPQHSLGEIGQSHRPFTLGLTP